MNKVHYSTYNTITNFIWSIADELLRDVYVRGKYRDVILPMTVIRRLDAILELTKESVINREKKPEAIRENKSFCKASGKAFSNTSLYTLKDLKNYCKTDKVLKDYFELYLAGFSSNVGEILSKFKFKNELETLVDANILGSLIEKYLDPNVNLSPEPILDIAGNEKVGGLDNHGMGMVFEELIRRFNEENNEEAGEHFTPRDVVNLMADLVLLPIADELKSGTYLVYDGACGTGGMLTLAEQRLNKLAKDKGKNVKIHLYGQEIQPETYAIAKADLLLKGKGEAANNIKYGSTLSSDAFATKQFDFMLSNPPYGKSWRTDLKQLSGTDGLKDAGFIVGYGGDNEYKLITRSSDGQLMFLVNKLMKMRDSKLGSRIVHIHNGSSLSTGDAGGGESNIRRWIIENDWLEGIIALPSNIFYNTAIATYIWVLTNRKSLERKGKVQLIDARGWYKGLRKKLGNKSCELSERDINEICSLINHPKETEQSKILPNESFGYKKIVVERPLRLSLDLSIKRVDNFKKLHPEYSEQCMVLERLVGTLGEGPHRDYNMFIDAFKSQAKVMSVRVSTNFKKLLKEYLGVVDGLAKPVIKKVHKRKRKANPLYGLYERRLKNKKVLVEYEADKALRETEYVCLKESRGIAGFMEREVSPYYSDGWVDCVKTEIGYEISFSKYFYKPLEMRSPEEIKAEIAALEKESSILLKDIVGDLNGRL